MTTEEGAQTESTRAVYEQGVQAQQQIIVRLLAEIERLQELWETADSVAQMAAHDRDEALANFARVEQEYGYLVALLQRARVSLMGLMDAGTWSEPRGFRIDAEAALSEAHATIREIEEATDIGDQE